MISNRGRKGKTIIDLFEKSTEYELTRFCPTCMVFTLYLTVAQLVDKFRVVTESKRS